MNEYKRGETNAVVLAGMCTALAVVLSLIGLYMPMLSLLAFLLIPLPIAYLGMKEGVRWSIIVTSGVMILDSTFFGIVSAAFLCAVFGVLGVVLGYCYKNEISGSKTLLIGSVTVLISLLGEAMATVYILGMPSHLLGGGFTELEGSMKEVLPMFYSGDNLTAVEQNMQVMMESLKKSVPFAVVAGAIFYAWASMTLAKIVFNRLGIKGISTLPPLERWELPRTTIYVYGIVLLLQYTLASHVEWGEMISYVAYNVGSFCVLTFWLQGIATLWWMPHRYPAMKPFRFILLLLSIFIQLFQLAIVFLGMADMGTNYRKKRNYE